MSQYSKTPLQLTYPSLLWKSYSVIRDMDSGTRRTWYGSCAGFASSCCLRCTITAADAKGRHGHAREIPAMQRCLRDSIYHWGVLLVLLVFGVLGTSTGAALAADADTLVLAL